MSSLDTTPSYNTASAMGSVPIAQHANAQGGTPIDPRVNPLAPTLTGTLSLKVADYIAQMQAKGTLSTYACKHTSVIRRDHHSRDKATVLRPSFVRDSEKIVHLPAYNRLSDKTQVFSFRANDDITRRGLHVQLVGRVARDIGRALSLNLDLIEAIALGHDIGHTPFGHAGERFLSKVYHEHTNRYFFHNVQSVRVMDVLGGRNISLQTLDGALCHNGEFEQQVFQTSDLNAFDTFDRIVSACWENGASAIEHLRPMTLEGCVVRLADIIAYVGKDRQDAITAGLLSPDAFEDGLGGAYNAWALSAFVADVVEHSVGKDHLEMSPDAFLELRRAKKENYEKIYGAREVDGDFSAGVSELFSALYENQLEALTQGDESAAIFCHHIVPTSERLSYYGLRYRWEDDLDRCVVDFIASMTDAYFIALTSRLFQHAAELFPMRSYAW